MRYILIILVFLSVGANAQMVIKAHANYRPYAQPAVNLLLDDYPNAAAAYSLRKLDKDYTGNCVRIRRDSVGQTEQDFGFDASGYLDTAAIKNFCRANTGRLVTWYDQSGNARNISQSTSLSQPILWNGTAFQTLSSTINDIRKAPLFDGVTTSRLVASFTTISQPITTFSVVRLDNANASLSDVVYDSYNNTACGFFYSGAAESPNFRWGLYSGGAIFGTTAGNTSPNLFSNLHNGLSSSIRINGTSYASGNIGTNGMAGISVGGIRGNPNVIAPGYSLDGRIAELIVYGSDQSSNRTGIENNINDYYNIYWNGDFTGLLDTYGSSAAAYSLRNLSSTYKGPLIRVRKDTTGQPEMDVYGDYYGNLDTVGLKNFLSTRSGRVTIWYDQSGNGRNKINTTAATQPEIAFLGVIKRTNGKPCVNFQAGNVLTSASTYTITHSVQVAKVIAQTVVNYIYTNANIGFFWNGTAGGVNGIGAFDGTNARSLTGEDLNQHLAWYSMRGGNIHIARDGGTETNTGAFAASITVDRIGGRQNAAGIDFQGEVQEVVAWNSDQSSNRTGIQSNINTFYGIY